MVPLIWSAVGSAVLLAGASFAAYTKGKDMGAMQVQQLWDQERADRAEAVAEEAMKARQREAALQAHIDKMKRERRHEAKRIADQFAADLERLRNRPEARAGAGGLPEGARPGVGCTGEGLARADAEFLTRLATDASRLRAALGQCQAQYNAVKEQINGSGTN